MADSDAPAAVEAVAVAETAEVAAVAGEEQTSAEQAPLPAAGKPDGGKAALRKGGGGGKLNIFLALVSVAIDTLGISIILPVLPYLAIRFDASSLQVGVLFSAYALTQFLSVPLTGRASDRFGRRPLLLLSLVGSCIGFLLQGLADSLVFLTLARGMAGLVGASAPIASAVVADSTTPAERPKYLAALGSVIALSFLVGPSMGAGLAQFTLSTPMYVASGLSGFAFVFSWFKFKETLPSKVKRAGDGATSATTATSSSDPSGKPGGDDDTSAGAGAGAGAAASGADKTATPSRQRKRLSSAAESDDASAADKSAKSPRQRRRLSSAADDHGDDAARDKAKSKVSPFAQLPGRHLLVRLVVASTFFNMLAFSAFLAMLGLYVEATFEYGSLELGFITSGVSILYILVQVFLFPALHSRFGSATPAVLGGASMALGLCLLPLPDVPGVFFLTLAPMAVGYGLTTPSLQTQLSLLSLPTEQGRNLGLGATSDALARVIGPIVLGAAFNIGKGAPFFMAGGSALLCAAFMLVVRAKTSSLSPAAMKRKKLEQGADDAAATGATAAADGGDGSAAAAAPPSSPVPSSPSASAAMRLSDAADVAVDVTDVVADLELQELLLGVSTETTRLLSGAEEAKAPDTAATAAAVATLATPATGLVSATDATTVGVLTMTLLRRHGHDDLSATHLARLAVLLDDALANEAARAAAATAAEAAAAQRAADPDEEELEDIVAVLGGQTNHLA